MRKNINFLFIFACVTLMLAACNNDDDNDKFLTGEEAKNAIIGDWHIKSISAVSNYSELDKVSDYLFETLLLNVNIMQLSFDADSVTTQVKMDNIENAYPDGIVARDKYQLVDDNLYIKSSSLTASTGTTVVLPFKYTITNKNLAIKMTVNKLMLTMLVNMTASMITDATLQSWVQSVLTAVPDDYSGEITINLTK